MKNIVKKVFLVILILSALSFINCCKVNAALQSNGGSPKTYNLNDWMINVRKMQSMDGALGLNDTISDNLTSNSTTLDIHMEKNTEYGAMAILSASAYGNPNKIENGQTTTGNKTGVYINLNIEKVAAGYPNGGASSYQGVYFVGAAARYKNLYRSSTTGYPGDATKETWFWHGGSSTGEWTSYHNYNYSDDVRAGMVRAGDSIFSWSTYSHQNGGVARADYARASRAAVVVGQNL